MANVSVCIDVLDIKKATQFYANALECDIKNEEKKSSQLTAENITIHLLEKEEKTNPLVNESASRHYSRHWTPVHLDFSVNDVEKTLSLIQKFGGTVEGKEEGDWGIAAFCADPFGNGFCVIKIN